MTAVAGDGSIGVYDLKNHLSAVLEEVVGGREITVTKHGRPVARIAPVSAPSQTERVAALAALHALSARTKPLPDDLTIRDLIDEGRRS